MCVCVLMSISTQSSLFNGHFHCDCFATTYLATTKWSPFVALAWDRRLCVRADNGTSEPKDAPQNPPDRIRSICWKILCTNHVHFEMLAMALFSHGSVHRVLWTMATQRKKSEERKNNSLGQLNNNTKNRSN